MARSFLGMPSCPCTALAPQAPANEATNHTTLKPTTSLRTAPPALTPQRQSGAQRFYRHSLTRDRDLVSEARRRRLRRPAQHRVTINTPKSLCPAEVSSVRGCPAVTRFNTARPARCAARAGGPLDAGCAGRGGPDGCARHAGFVIAAHLEPSTGQRRLRTVARDRQD